MSVRSPLIEVLSGPTEGPESSGVDKVLHAVRTHLGMDVAFVSEFREADRIMRNVDSVEPAIIRPGDAIPLEQGYCQRVVDGRLPELIRDAQKNRACLELPETRAIPIGAHLSVPIRLRDGRLYGTFCCFSFSPDETLSLRDLGMMRAFADLLADQIDRDERTSRAYRERVTRIKHVMESPTQPHIVFQPIFDLVDNVPSGFEALSRFTMEPHRPPDQWFNEAATIGLGRELEEHAIANALAGLDSLPASAYVSVNASPRAAMGASFDALLRRYDLSRIVLEITEHDQIDDYTALLGALTGLRAAGMRIAVDDAGAGFASIRHVLSLRPDFIKLDMSLTRDIDKDKTRRAFASALITFANETNALLVAEGIETPDELAALRRLGVILGQGYLLSRPIDIAEAARLTGPIVSAA